MSYGNYEVEPTRIPSQRAFMQIFWGLLFIAVDIKVNELDVLVP
jgi:hypothetical protein